MSSIPAVFGLPSPGRTYGDVVRSTPGLDVYWEGETGRRIGTTNYTLPAAFTFEFWMKPSSSPQSNVGLFNLWNTNGPLWWWDTGAHISWRLNASEMNTGIVPAANVWTHCVGTFDGTNRVAFVNGVLMGGPTASSVTAPAARALELGSYLGGYFMAGTLADAAVYRRALTQAEARQHYVVGMKARGLAIAVG